MTPVAPRPLFIYGAGGHAKVVADIARMDKAFVLEGFIDDAGSGEFLGLPVLTFGEFTGVRAPADCAVCVGIGDSGVRRERFFLLANMGFLAPVLVHPHAAVAQDVSLGEGTVIMAGAVVNPGSLIGKGCIVNTKASVDHDCALGDFVHIAPGATLGGGVNIGSGTWIGINSAVREYCSVGNDALVGMGAVVVHNLPDGVVAVGVPARIVKARSNWPESS